jgi:hypothetical protein
MATHDGEAQCCPECAKKYGHNYTVVFAQV